MLSFERLLMSMGGGGYSSGGATALPQSGSVVARWSASDLALADGAAVASWTDSAGGAAATQGTGAQQPTYRANLFGGRPGVRFDGVDDLLQIGRPAALAAAIDSKIYSVLIVMRVLTAKTLGAAFAASAGGDSFYMLADGANVGRFHGGTGRTAPYASAGFTVMGNSSITPYAKGSGTGLERVYLQGGCVSSYSNAGVTSGALNFSLGALTGNTSRANVELFEVIVWSTTLTPAEYLQATKWACELYSQPYPWAGLSRFVIMDGNSLTANVGATVATGYPYLTAQALGLAYGQWSLTAVGGITVGNMQANLPDWSSIGTLTGLPLRVAGFEYYNARTLNEPGVHNATNAYAAAVRAIPNTKLALGTSLSNSLDPSPTLRDVFNSYYDANYAANCDAYIPMHTNASIGVSGAYAANGAGAGLNLYYDGVHLLPAGYAILAPLMTAGLNAIP